MILVIIGIAYSGLYIYSLSKVEIKDVKVNGLEDVSLSGFTLSGNIELYNGGIVPVSFDHIEYAINLESDNHLLGNGYIRGDTLIPGKTTAVPFSNKINWIPAAEVALNLITPGKTYANINGIVFFKFLGFIDFEKSFTHRVDLEIYIKQFIKQTINQTVDKVVNTVQHIGEGIKTLANKTVNAISHLLG